MGIIRDKALALGDRNFALLGMALYFVVVLSFVLDLFIAIFVASNIIGRIFYFSLALWCLSVLIKDRYLFLDAYDDWKYYK